MNPTVAAPHIVNTVAGCYGAVPPCLNLPTPGSAVGFVPSGFVELVLIFLFVGVCEAILYGFHLWVTRRGGDPLEVRSSYSSLVSLALSWALIIVIGVWWLGQTPVLAAVANNQETIAADQGAALFAQYCVPCHGPRGEGFIGAPLNIPELRGDPSTDPSVYAFLVTTISDGRPGYVGPTWVKAADGHWQSETAMPQWAQTQGGSLTADQINSLATFIMMGDWNQVLTDIAAEAPPTPNGAWPTTSSMPAAQQKQAQALIEQIGCLNCHTIGGVNDGGKVGPDITTVDSWSKDPSWKQFIYDWIQDPQTMSKQQMRAPIYWNPEYSHTTPNLVFGTVQKMTLPDTYMPKYQMTDQQRQLIVDYLFSIK
ncbi:MAG TPA: cytochrome c [Bacillota bacterium]|nr:cytochrome c [Bacillota bacterium]